ncbi:MAG: transglycosylase domain-containing protein [Bacteroidales bacterium]|nr:transglycosylase domain-containing protein [Bacteroidales bacterium]
MRTKKKSPLKKILLYSSIAILSVALFSILLFFMVYMGAFGSLPNKEKLLAIHTEQASLVYSSDGVIIGKYFAKNRTNVGWNDIPDNLVHALVATEDRRFFTHQGYDLRSYFRVLVKSILLGENTGGGSTLTQQLAKNLYGRHDYGFLSLPIDKIKEVIIASRLEDVYSKKELLLLYLNSVPFGENVYGVESAAHRYFNKQARDLTPDESAVLVALLKANTYYDPRLHPEHSIQRRNLVLTLMEQQHYLSPEEATRLKKLPLKLDYENVSLDAPAGYFVYQVKQRAIKILDSIQGKTGKDYNIETDGLKIYTTLNVQIQRFAREAVKRQLAVMQPRLDRELENSRFKKQWFRQHHIKNDSRREVDLFTWNGIQTKNITQLDSLWYYYKMLNAAVLVTNPKNGAVLSWIGGNNFRYLPFDMVLSHRQIASTFKPVLYGTALENGYSPCTYLNNEEKKYPNYQDWEPQNYDHSSSTDSTVAFWYALANSMNIPTVDLYFKVGRENLINTCNKLDFPAITGNDPSIAIGSLDLSLAEIVRAYGTFANNGEMNNLFMINKITDASGNILYQRNSSESEQVFSKETCQTLTAVLQQVINQGTGIDIRKRYGIQADLAGKTGTAQDYSNAWFMAYTPDIVLGTWVGASTPDVHFYDGNGTGASLALPIVANVIRGIEKNPELSLKYLTPFNIPENTYAFLQCDPYRQIGIKGFFNRLFQGKAKSDNRSPHATKEKKNESGIVSFFKKLFGRKK